MWFFTGRSTGCVVVIGWQADAISDQLVDFLRPDQPLYVVSSNASSPASAARMQHIDADLNDPDAIKAVFMRLAKRGCHPELVIFQAEPATRTPSEHPMGYDSAQLEQRWQQTGFRLFLWAQAALAVLQDTAKKRRPATLITLGADLATQPNPSLAADSALYAGMRAVMQSLAREFQPQGIHVAYVGLAADSSVSAAAKLCWQLHQQPRSAWTHEVTLVG